MIRLLVAAELDIEPDRRRKLWVEPNNADRRTNTRKKPHQRHRERNAGQRLDRSRSIYDHIERWLSKKEMIG
jgi:hypothetical protein